MISRSEKIRLGVFLLVSSSVLGITVVVLAGMSLLKSVESYNVNFAESVSGLEVGAQVKYNGVRVGQVSDIRIPSDDPTNVEVVLELRKGTPIKTDTKAVLTGMGITGLKFVELTGGSSEAEHLQPGDPIQAGHSLMGTLGGKAESITTKTDIALSKINAVLSETNISNVEAIISNVKGMSEKLDKLISDNEYKIATIVDDLGLTAMELREGSAAANRSMARVDRLLQETSPDVEEIVANLNETSRRFKKTANDLAKIDDIMEKISATITDFEQKMARVDVEGISNGIKSTVDEANATLSTIRHVVENSRDNIHRSTYSLRRTLRNLEEFSALIREQPSLLLSNKKQKDRPAPED